MILFVGGSVLLRDAYNSFTCGTCEGSVESALERRSRELSRTRILAVGDSRMAVGFDTREVADSYNDGLFGANYAQIYYRFKQTLELAPKLDTVLVSLGPYSFYMGPDNPRGTNSAIPVLATREDSTEFAAVFRIDSTADDPNAEPSGDYLSAIRTFASGLFPYAGQSQLLWDRFRMPAAESAFMGYTVREVASQTAPRSGKDRAESIFGQVDGPSAVATHFIRRLVELAIDDGLTVILVRLPVSEDYADEAEGYVDTSDYDGWIGELLSRHDGTGIRYIDLHSRLFERPNVFQDGDHLNGAGARAATRLLQIELSGLTTDQVE